ncbi:unnamed protein product [Oppiella nova]|uniref:Uncharacterized protein n=1 Tax=Oppiella nova TaxID=334625 RepID=A0A7R9M351_9ACAR|nr:unnamed protein product [Oppiella nova]CAG2169349.1 unnamed protein product [Oppiella nova]
MATKADPKKDESVTTSDKREASPPKPLDPLDEQRRRARFGSLFCVVFIAVLSFIILDDKYLNLNIGGNSSAVQISSYWHKLEFVLCYQSIGISWILFNMILVISKRMQTKVVDPIDAKNERAVLVASAIMQNSIEQFLLSAFAQIISISFIDKSLLIKVIPLINILFITGRVAFWWGYPKNRTFGFMCSAIPNTLLINYNLLKFIQSLFF